MNFTDSQRERYLRHIILKGVGAEGQKKLLQSAVLIVGTGGLGSPAAMYLAAAGIGRIGIIDNDVVELVNLQRQIIHKTGDIGSPKVKSATRELKAINPDIKIDTYNKRFTEQNALELISKYDFVIDGTDNFPSRYLINDVCVKTNTAFSYGGVIKFKGQTMTVVPHKSACFRCLFQSPPPEEAVPRSCQAGILGVIPGVIGCLQAAEAIKHLLGLGDLLTNQLLIYNALTSSFRKITFKKNTECSVCGTSR